MVRVFGLGDNTKYSVHVHSVQRTVVYHSLLVITVVYSFLNYNL
jgi:hypothetical protein